MEADVITEQLWSFLSPCSPENMDFNKSRLIFYFGLATPWSNYIFRIFTQHGDCCSVGAISKYSTNIGRARTNGYLCAKKPYNTLLIWVFWWTCHYLDDARHTHWWPNKGTFNPMVSIASPISASINANHDIRKSVIMYMCCRDNAVYRSNSFKFERREAGPGSGLASVAATHQVCTRNTHTPVTSVKEVKHSIITKQ